MRTALTLIPPGGEILTNLNAGADPIGGIHDSIPLHPEDKHPDFEEFKQKKKRIPAPNKSPEHTNGYHRDSDHQIDDYA